MTNWAGRAHFQPVASRVQVDQRTLKAGREMSRERFVAFVGTDGVI